jgi:hypothetical protein
MPCSSVFLGGENSTWALGLREFSQCRSAPGYERRLYYRGDPFTSRKSLCLARSWEGEGANLRNRCLMRLIMFESVDLVGPWLFL